MEATVNFITLWNHNFHKKIKDKYYSKEEAENKEIELAYFCIRALNGKYESKFVKSLILELSVQIGFGIKEKFSEEALDKLMLIYHFEEFKNEENRIFLYPEQYLEKTNIQREYEILISRALLIVDNVLIEKKPSQHQIDKLILDKVFSKWNNDNDYYQGYSFSKKVWEVLRDLLRKSI